MYIVQYLYVYLLSGLLIHSLLYLYIYTHTLIYMEKKWKNIELNVGFWIVMFHHVSLPEGIHSPGCKARCCTAPQSDGSCGRNLQWLDDSRARILRIPRIGSFRNCEHRGVPPQSCQLQGGPRSAWNRYMIIYEYIWYGSNMGQQWPQKFGSNLFLNHPFCSLRKNGWPSRILSSVGQCQATRRAGGGRNCHCTCLRPALHPNIAVVHCKRPPTIDDDLFYRQTHLDGQKSPAHLGISGLSAPKPMPYPDQQGLVSLRGHQVPCIQDGHVPVFGFRLRKLMGHAIPQASECCRNKETPKLPGKIHENLWWCWHVPSDHQLFFLHILGCCQEANTLKLDAKLLRPTSVKEQDWKRKSWHIFLIWVSSCPGSLANWEAGWGASQKSWGKWWEIMVKTYGIADLQPWHAVGILSQASTDHNEVVVSAHSLLQG